jgi:hypothetical protein
MTGKEKRIKMVKKTHTDFPDLNLQPAALDLSEHYPSCSHLGRDNVRKKIFVVSQGSINIEESSLTI